MTTKLLSIGVPGLFLASIAITSLSCTREARDKAARAEAMRAATVAALQQPRARLRISGFMQGRLEPCGCASGQMGGLPRRVFHLKQQPNYDLLIEGGNIVAGENLLDAYKFRTAALVLSMMVPYHAVALGPAELTLAAEDLAQTLEVFETPAVASDLVAPEGMAWPATAFREHKAGEATVRVASLVLHKPDSATAKKLRLLPPADAWRRALEGAAPSTYRVLLVHGKPEEVRAQASLQPRPDLIVGITDEISEPPGDPEPVNDVPVVYPGTRGRMLLDVTLTRQAGSPRVTSYRIVKLDKSKTSPGALEDQDTVAAILGHRMEVQQDGVLEKMAGLRAPKNGAKYVGSEACADCHEEAYDVWKKTNHASAWETLEKAEKGPKYGWPVTAYPDCVSCHVVGYGERSGFVNLAKTPHLKAVGCEQCHGAGSAHVDSGGEKRLGKVEPASCLRCHDFEQSPNFADNYAERWRKIEHK